MDFSELKELLVAETVYNCLKEREDELFELIPELRVCKGFDQKNDWHVYDVYEHILHVVAGVEPELIVRLTALFHDVGKPLAFSRPLGSLGSTLQAIRPFSRPDGGRDYFDLKFDLLP